MEACPPRLARGGQIEPVEQHVPKLLGRADVERSAGGLMDFGRQPVEIVLDFAQKVRQGGGVEPHACRFHISENRDEGQFQPGHKLKQPGAGQAAVQVPGNGQRQGGRVAGGRSRAALQCAHRRGQA